MNKVVRDTKWLDKFYFFEIKYPLLKTEREATAGVCYVIFNPLSGLYKIGHTRRSVFDRRNILSTQSGILLEIILAVFTEAGHDEPCHRIESLLHEFFSEKRINGEWFQLSIKDLIQIKLLFCKIEGDSIMDKLKEHVTVSRSF